MKLETREALQAARDLIARGWCQGANTLYGFLDRKDLPLRACIRHVADENTDKVCHCLYGALRKVVPMPHSSDPFYASRLTAYHTAVRDLALEMRLIKRKVSPYLTPGQRDKITKWNDDPDRTHAEVLALSLIHISEPTRPY